MEFQQVKSEILRSKKFLPVLLGAVTGFLYYTFVGCFTGHCAITSNPWSSTILGALVGAAFIKKPNNNGNSNNDITETK